MSCTQQLKESNNIIESLKKQLTTFANDIRPDYYNTIPKENINIYQCSTLLTTATSLLVITILITQKIIPKNFELSKSLEAIKKINKEDIYKINKEDLRALIFNSTTAFIFSFFMLILYSLFLHYSRKNMFEGLDEEENKIFEKVFEVSFGINTTITLFLGLGILWAFGILSLNNFRKPTFKKPDAIVVIYVLIGILMAFGMIMSFILWPEKKDEIDKRTEIKKNEKQIKNVTKENFLSSESKWVEIANNNCSLQGWTEVFYNPKETYIPGVGSLQDSFINKLEYEVHKLKGAMEPITWGQFGSSREGHFRDFYFYKKRGYPQDMTPVWNALYDVAQNYNSRFPGSKFGIVQTERRDSSYKNILKFTFADFKNVDYSQRGTNTIPTKYWIPQPQTLAKLKERNYKERCNK